MTWHNGVMNNFHRAQSLSVLVLFEHRVIGFEAYVLRCPECNRSIVCSADEETFFGLQILHDMQERNFTVYTKTRCFRRWEFVLRLTTQPRQRILSDPPISYGGFSPSARGKRAVHTVALDDDVIIQR